MNTVTNRQMFFMIFTLVTNYSAIVLPYTMARAAGKGAWVTILLASFIFAIAIIFLCKLNNMYMGKMIFDYSKEIVGKIFGNIIIFYAIGYFILKYCYMAIEMSNFIKMNFLPKTPLMVIAILGTTGMGLIVNKGITNTARAIEIMAPLYIGLSTIAFTVLLFQGIFYNVLPMFEPDKIKDYIFGIKDAVMPFLGIELILIIPFTSQNKKMTKLMFLTILLVGLYYVLVYEACLNMLGINSMQIYVYAYLEAIKLEEIPVLERVDVLFQTIGFIGICLRYSLTYVAIVELAGRVFIKVKRWLITLITGVILVLLCAVLNGITDIDKLMVSLLTILGILTTIIIPITLFIIAKVKKNAEKKSEDNSKETA